jgi:prolyl oligopeptidase
MAAPPKTPREPVADDYFGTKVVDPYRWLEGSAAPELKVPDPELDARVSAWTDGQNAYTRALLDRWPGRKKLEARLAELLESGSIGLPQVRGGRYFYSERKGTEAQPVLYLREGYDAKPRVLINPNTMAADGLTAMAWFVPSQNGKLIAYGIYRSGDENAVLHLRDVDTGRELPDVISGKVEQVYWTADSAGFLYHRLADLGNPYSGQVKFHRLGQNPDQDALLFEQYKEGPLATTWGPSAYTNDAAKWLVLTYWTGTESNDLWVYNLEDWRQTGKLERRDVVIGKRALSSGPVVGDTLHLQTTLDAPNGRVIAVDLNHPEPEHWQAVIPERPVAVIRNTSAASGHLVVEYLQNAYTHIALFDLAGQARGELELPGIGTASIATQESSDEAFVHFESFNQPPSIYRVKLASGDSTLWARPDVPADPSVLTVEQVWYPSQDGTKISMFLVHRKDLDKNGKIPTILYGYGGFNIPETPTFNPARFAWLESGGLFALANLRGGGEYGDAWHRAGMLADKQNVFDDFIAAAEWLIASGYTSTPQLGIFGGSNGGLLTGAALVQRPELFGAVVSAVPLLDMLRYQHFLMARYWVPEYGSAEDRQQFDYLIRYSPYQNVKPGVKYPAVLLTAGEHDTRVAALHARKMAARLQASTASSPAEQPVLLWVEREAGHSLGKPLKLRVQEAADIYDFFAWQLGLELAPKSADTQPLP